MRIDTCGAPIRTDASSISIERKAVLRMTRRLGDLVKVKWLGSFEDK